jgi:hypothetical protein
MLEVRQSEDGWDLYGVVVAAFDGCPGRVRYRVGCDALWRTLSVDVAAGWGCEGRSLRLAADQESRWWSEARDPGARRELQAVGGCVDVDLEVTPSTNTLPIRRLDLPVGESRELTAAWVRFPDLAVQPLAQRYTRLEEHLYQYESLNSGFSADLQVDHFGLVVRYTDLWESVASFQP